MPRKKTMGRGANGTGSIRKITTVKNNKEYTYWQARYTAGYDPGTGKQIQRTISGKTQKEVAQKLKQVTHEIDQGSYRAPTKLSVGEWLDLWKSNYLVNLKPRTVEIYSTAIRVHIQPALGAIKLDALTPQTLQAFYNALAEKKQLAPKSVKDIHGIVHKALQQAVALGYLRLNPADACVLPRVEKKEITPLDDHDIASFLNHIRGGQFEILLTVALFTGMRQGEIMALTWDCIDFTRGTITINKQIQRYREEHGIYRIAPTKNGKSRVIAPAYSVMLLLRKQQAYQSQLQKEAGSAWEKSDLVFTDLLGHHLTNSIVYRHFKRAATAIGRPDARFHDLRHSYAVAAIRSGDDIKTVQGNLGHATASFTLDVYGHVTDQMKKNSSDRMEAYIQSFSQ